MYFGRLAHLADPQGRLTRYVVSLPPEYVEVTVAIDTVPMVVVTVIVVTGSKYAASQRIGVKPAAVLVECQQPVHVLTSLSLQGQ